MSRGKISTPPKPRRRRSDQSLGDILVSERQLSPKTRCGASRRYVLGIPFVNLKDKSPVRRALAHSRTHRAHAQHHRVPRRDGDTLEVAMLDVEDLASIDSVKKKTGLKILAAPDRRPRVIKHALLQYQKSLKDEFGDIIATRSGEDHSVVDEKDGEGARRTTS